MGTQAQILHPYGIGIDTHKQFIQVCLLVQTRGEITRYEDEFETTWEGLHRARAFVNLKLHAHGQVIKPEELRYTIESTGCYHIPVLLAWKGRASIVNPMLSGSTRRKTDVLDARMLSHHSICGLWPESFLPTTQLQVLRVLLQQRNEAGRNATRCTNRINNCVLRFGHTVGRDNSLRDRVARSCVEDLCEGRIPIHPGVAPTGLPEEVRPFFLLLYQQFDRLQAEKKDFEERALAYARQCRWPTGFGTIDGKTLIECLKSCPGVGIITALTWLAVIGDPRRFKSSEEVAAYCGSDPSVKVSAGKVTATTKRRGNSIVHHVLKTVSAHMIHQTREPLGVWGKAIAKRTAKGGMGRAVNAVARRLAIFLWHAHMHGSKFDYARYRFHEVPQVEDMPVGRMNLTPRVLAALRELQLARSQEVVNAMDSVLLNKKGFGAACLKELRQWVNEHRQPVRKPAEGSSPLVAMVSGTPAPLLTGGEGTSVKSRAKRSSKSPTRVKRTGVQPSSPRGTRQKPSRSVS